MDTLLQDKTNLFSSETISGWDVSDWSSFDKPIYSNGCPDVIPETSPGKLTLARTLRFLSLVSLSVMLHFFRAISKFNEER